MTITGTSFGASQGTSAVTFNGTASTPTSWSSTSITVPVPTGATTGSVLVIIGASVSNPVAFTVSPTPSITSLSQTSGAVGTSVTITGTNFGSTQGTSTVTFNGTVGMPTAWSATSITVPVPIGATTGNIVVTVSGVATNGVSFTVLATPTITTLNPTSGPALTPVTITGTNFGAAQGTSTVTFNGTAATPTAWSATSITVPVPSGATNGNVVVTVSGVPSAGVSFTVLATPSIASLDPTSGPVATAVTITGTNFGATQGTSTVTFNGTAGAPTGWSDTSITVPVPSGATTGNVVITAGGVASNGVGFTVTAGITSLSPTSGPVGTTVTIAGTNFGATQGTSTVTFKGTAGAPTSWSATSITVRVPSGATTGNVVITAGGVASNGVGFSVTPPGAPISDDFTGSDLNPMWTFQAQCCGFVRMSGTDALLVVPSVTPHNIWNTNQGVTLLEPTADVDFEVEAKFDSAVTVAYQEQGIFVQQDANNFIYFAVFSDGSSPRLLAITTIAGTPTIQYNNQISSGGAPFWLRVKRSGTTWTESWSIDGKTYNPGTDFVQPITVTAVGPIAGNSTLGSNPAPGFTAAVDYFFNTAAPVSPADGGMPAPPNAPVFNIWYGDDQTFGQNGIPQTWINVLGNVSAPSGIASLTYSLNGGAAQPLWIGQNLVRLVDPGDFNAEIAYSSLQPGANTVQLTATDNNGAVTQHTVTANYVAGQTWPLNYSIDWSTVNNIQSVAQIVDGNWALQNNEARTMQTGYDRLIDFGDMNTWTNLVGTVEITLNAVDCTAYGVGPIVGWTGHTTANNGVILPDQPRTGHPFPAWFVYNGTGLSIYANTAKTPETTLVQNTTQLTIGVKYVFKFQVTSNTSGGSHFSFKVWQSGTSEPPDWQLEADGVLTRGSILIGADQADISVGAISITSLP